MSAWGTTRAASSDSPGHANAALGRAGATADGTAGQGLPASVVTCSDSGARRLSPDGSGPLAAQLLRELGHQVQAPVVVQDDVDAITAAIRAAIASGSRIVVTTGGTGAGPRDVTPEALRSLGLRELPGLGEAMRAAARARIPAADLSRGLGGVVGDVVVLALPGSPGGVRDGLTAVGGLLEHAAKMAAGGGHSEYPPLRVHVVDSAHETDRIDYADLVRDGVIAEAEVAAAVGTSRAGAVVSFAGVVRDHDHGRTVVALSYEAHPEAGQAMAEVLAEARRRPGVLGAAARHRVGDLAVGDVAFVAAVSAAHRAEAFDACAWLVDEVKARLPVWKHQRFADGTAEWVNCA